MNDIVNSLKTNIGCVRLQDPENILEIKSFQSQLEKRRTEQIERVVEFVTEICKSLEGLKSDVFKMGTEEFNSDKLRAKMVKLEEKIINLKQALKEELTKVVNDESALHEELKFFQKRMEVWSKPVNLQNYELLKPKTCAKNQNQDNNPVVEFKKFVSNFRGHYGGWLEQDHLLFLRERKKNKDKEKFFAAVLKFLPDLNYNDIVEHENWYKKYEFLKNAQKEAIQRWKAHKLEIQEKKVEKKECEEKQEIKSNNKAMHQINVAERIRQWKKQQLAKKTEEIERQKQEEIQLQREKKKIKEMQKKKKIAVNQYKAEKLNKMQANSILQEEKKNRDEAIMDAAKKNILLKSFRLQDVKFTEKKKMIRLQLESKAASKVERLKISKPSFDLLLQRDPQRIFKSTIIWNQHCQPSEKKEKFDCVLDLNTIPHLAIPEWRRELK